MRTHEIMAALANRHAGGEWAYVEEVANSTGGPASRSGDAMALNLWPSRGLELHGFEVKASRSDWLRELKAPEKADVLFGYCNRWWVAVGDKGIVQDGELPPTWGLLVPRGSDLVVKVQAPALDPKPLSRHFIAAFVRRATASIGHREGSMTPMVPPELLSRARVDDWIRFKPRGMPFTVQARNRRFIIATRPFAPKKTVLYTVIDLKEQVRGPDNLIFCMGYETREACELRLIDLVDGSAEVSHRKRVPLGPVSITRRIAP